MKMQACFILFFLAFFPLSGDAEKPNASRKRTPMVKYCDLVRNPRRFDGRLVRTEAVWQQMIHSQALADLSCSSPDLDPLLTLPSVFKGAELNRRLRNRLGDILRKGGMARVELVGVFHGPRGRDYAPDGQLFQIEIKCLITVTPQRLPE